MHVCLTCGRDYAAQRVKCEDCAGPVIRASEGDAVRSDHAGRLLGDKYRLLDELGSGAYGTVYRAKQLLLDRLVAIKVLRVKRAGRADALRRFYAEAQHTSRLLHPHNAKVHDFGHTDDGLVYIVMELVQGRSLAHVTKPMSSVRALGIARQICGAVAEAHELGLVHRDLKPENIMLGRVDDQDHVRVLDYGIAKAVHDGAGITAEGNLIGTPHYMSPEQVTGEAVDHRSDIYSTGVILYELLSGRVPFDADEPVAVVNQHAQQAPPSLLECGASVDPHVEDLVMRCLAKEPGARPQSMRRLRAAIDTVLAGGDAVEPSRPTLTDQVRDPGAAENRPASSRSAFVMVAFIALVLLGLAVTVRLVERNATSGEPRSPAAVPAAEERSLDEASASVDSPRFRDVLSPLVGYVSALDPVEPVRRLRSVTLSNEGPSQVEVADVERTSTRDDRRDDAVESAQTDDAGDRHDAVEPVIEHEDERDPETDLTLGLLQRSTRELEQELLRRQAADEAADDLDAFRRDLVERARPESAE